MPVQSEREQPIYVEIDWLDNGQYAHPFSNLSNVAANTSRLIAATLSTQRGRDAARPLGQPMASSASVQVHNADRLLSPEFAASPIYQLVEPGRGYRIRMSAGGPIAYDAPINYASDDFYGGTAIVSLVEGFLEEPSYETGIGAHVTTLSAVGSLSRLRRGTLVSTPLYQNVRVDQCLTYLLDAAGWPSSLRRISFGDTTIALWWLDAADPFSAMLELLVSEGAGSAIYEGTGGEIVFENRNFRSQANRSTVSRMTIAESSSMPILYDQPIAYDAPVAYDAGAAIMHGVLHYTPSFNDVRNQATYDMARRVAQTTRKVWEFGLPLTLGPGESRLITAVLGDPCDGHVAPVSGTDYTVVAGGSLVSSPTLENINAQRVGIRFVAGGSGATINGVTSNGPQLRAVPWPVVSEETVINDVDASVSIAKTKGVRSLSLAGRKEVNRSYALAVCNAAVRYYRVNRPVVTVPIENIDGKHLQKQLAFEVSDRITVDSSVLGMLDASLWIEQISHQRLGASLLTVLTCERVEPLAGAGLWEQGVWGDDTHQGALWGE